MSTTQSVENSNVRVLPPSKEKSERVTDSDALFTKLKAFALPESDPAHIVVKFFIDSWVEDGRPRIEKVSFKSVSKVVNLYLPRFVTQKPQLNMKSIDVPKTA